MYVPVRQTLYVPVVPPHAPGARRSLGPHHLTHEGEIIPFSTREDKYMAQLMFAVPAIRDVIEFAASC